MHSLRISLAVCLLVVSGCQSSPSAETVEEKLEQFGDRLEGASRAGVRRAGESLDHMLGGEPEPAADDYRPIPGAADAIECESEARCTITAAFIDQLEGNPALDGEASLAVAPTRDGAALLLSRVGPGSIPDLLGLQDGDLLISLNGTKLASIEGARSLADGLDPGTDQVTLVLDRDGHRRTLTVVRTP